MKGLEISEKYYEEYGAPMMEELFPSLVSRAAIGLAGEGSECLGFDDDVSRDHDFEPSFCIWLTDEDYEKYSFALSRAYASLPKEFMGLRRASDSPTGGARRGVLRTSDFYRRFLGSDKAPSSAAHWLSVPEHSLRAVTSGKVFCDELGEFSAVRSELLKGYPEDVRLKKLAAALIMSAQSGEYNYSRCLAHGDTGAAQLAIFTFVKNIIASIYLINNAYMPFYKWAYRGMSDLAELSKLSKPLVFLTESGNGENEANAKIKIVSDVSLAVSTALKAQGLIGDASQSLEASSYEVNGRIADPIIRNENIFAGMIRE